MTERTRAPGFYMLYASLILALAGGLLYGAEARLYGWLGLVLCISLFVGLIYKPTRWVSFGVTLILALCVAALSYWARGMH